MRIFLRLAAIFLAFFSLFYSANPAWAMGMEDFEWAHILSVGGGIAAPSATSALGENPAGLTYNYEFKGMGAIATDSSSINQFGAQGTVYLGNGSVGGGIGIQSFNDEGNNAGSLTLLNFGLAADISAIDLTFGASVDYTLFQNGATIGDGGTGPWSADAGLIYHPLGQYLRGGFTVFNIPDGIDAFGFGVAGDPSGWSTIAVDLTTGRNFTGDTLKPGIEIHLREVQMSLSYGIPLDSQNPSAWMRRYASAGLGVRLSDNFHIEFYYNELALYYVGLLIRI